jgi:CheY-like chemotaxis protein/HPt (histidine-containing phosphotransfer) domain-containing protein
MPYGSVLVVDDVETNLYVARGLLLPYGLKIDTALSGFEAIDKIRNGNVYDIIFMDHMMPKMDGIEAVRIIRSMGYTQPIVALTANALAGQADMFLKNGFDDFISKPIDTRRLNVSLNKLIRDKQPPEVIEAARKMAANAAAETPNQDIKPQMNPPLAEIFIRDAGKAAAALDEINANKCAGPNDLPSFIINVHAMKSALANMGEPELSAAALTLEEAGRESDIDHILYGLPPFLASLRGTIEKIRKKGETEDGTAADEDRSLLREKLLTIQAACAGYDKKAAKEVLADLRQKTWTRETKEQLNIIAEHLLHSEFEEAAKAADIIGKRV